MGAGKKIKTTVGRYIRLSTEGALERFVSLVAAHMLLEVCALAEATTADRTKEGLLSRVSPDVVLQSRQHVETWEGQINTYSLIPTQQICITTFTVKPLFLRSSKER